MAAVRNNIYSFLPFSKRQFCSAADRTQKLYDLLTRANSNTFSNYINGNNVMPNLNTIIILYKL